MIGTLYDVELLALAGGALVQVIAHPFAACRAASDDLKGLRQECLGHVIRVAGVSWFRLRTIARPGDIGYCARGLR